MIENKLQGVKAYLFDMDGTLYIGGKMIDGAKETLEFLRRNGKKVFFLTNNSSISVEDYLTKLQKYGLTNSIDEICSSSLSTIAYLKKNNLTKSVYLVGTKSLQREFVKHGIELVDDNPQTVVLSYDKELTYEKLVKLTKFIVKGANYIATHEDINCPNDDVYLPDIGSMMALVEKSVGIKPSAICGKPRKIMAEYVEEMLNLKPCEIAMVGDRLMTDIAFGINNNLVSVLVLSGETTMDDLKNSGKKPDYVFENAYGIVNELSKN
ncbi:MAG: HAD-IIA family hydrolase [Clostridia bacterium]